MALRSVVRIALLLFVVFVQLLPATTPASAQDSTTLAPRKQTRIGKKSVLEASLAAVMLSQDASGGFPAQGGSVDPRITADFISMMIALRNEGVEIDLDAALAYVQTTDPNAWAETEFVSVTKWEIARSVMALVAAGGDPRDVGGADLVEQLASSWNAENGYYGDSFFDSPVVMMALAAAGEPIEAAAFEKIEESQLADGSWAADGGTGPGYAWTTAYIVQLLAAIGRGDDPMVDKAVAYFRTLQGEDGAFGTEPGDSTDSYTTGLIVSALIAAGENLKDGDWGDIVGGLLKFQKENGWFMANPLDPYDNPTGTIAAVIALAGAYLPVVVVAE